MKNSTKWIILTIDELPRETGSETTSDTKLETPLVTIRGTPREPFRETSQETPREALYANLGEMETVIKQAKIKLKEKDDSEKTNREFESTRTFASGNFKRNRRKISSVLHS